MADDRAAPKFGLCRPLLGALFVVVLMLPNLAPRAEEPAGFQVGGFDFTVPAGWQQVTPSKPMRKAQLRVSAPGDAHGGTVVFYHFPPGVGGGVEANIDRWYAQFTEPRDELDAQLEVDERDGQRIHVFRATGTFIGTDGHGRRSEVPGYSFMGAILEGEDGNVFIRFVAPQTLAANNETAFRALVASPFD
jgi:hypothetical protein